MTVTDYRWWVDTVVEEWLITIECTVLAGSNDPSEAGTAQNVWSQQGVCTLSRMSETVENRRRVVDFVFTVFYDKDFWWRWDVEVNNNSAVVARCDTCRENSRICIFAENWNQLKNGIICSMATSSASTTHLSSLVTQYSVNTAEVRKSVKSRSFFKFCPEKKTQTDWSWEREC